MDKIVSINIKDITNGFFINDYPIMLYLNELDNIEDVLINSEEFIKMLKTYINDINFSNLIMYICYYDDTNEKLEKIENEIQNIFNINAINEEFWYSFVVLHFMNLYNSSFKNELIDTTKYNTQEQLIIYIYNKLKEKYPHKINKTTVINYILSKIQETNKKLNQTNLNIIKENLINTLNY